MAFEVRGEPDGVAGAVDSSAASLSDGPAGGATSGRIEMDGSGSGADGAAAWLGACRFGTASTATAETPSSSATPTPMRSMGERGWGEVRRRAATGALGAGVTTAATAGAGNRFPTPSVSSSRKSS
jgi:hypothetical protein